MFETITISGNDFDVFTISGSGNTRTFIPVYGLIDLDLNRLSKMVADNTASEPLSDFIQVYKLDNGRTAFETYKGVIWNYQDFEAALVSDDMAEFLKLKTKQEMKAFLA